MDILLHKVAATAQNWLTPCQEGKQGLLQEKSGEVKKMVGRVLRIPNYRSKGIKCGIKEWIRTQEANKY